MSHKYLFQLPRHASFVSTGIHVFFYSLHHGKKPHFSVAPFNARQTKSISAGTTKFGQHLCQIHTNTQK